MRMLGRFKMSSELLSLSCAESTRPSSLLTRNCRVKMWQQFYWRKREMLSREQTSRMDAVKQRSTISSWHNGAS